MKKRGRGMEIRRKRKRMVGGAEESRRKDRQRGRTERE